MDNKLLASPMEIKIFSLLGAFLVGLIIVSFVFGQQVERGGTSSPARVVINPFENLNIVAKSAIVLDVRTNKILFIKNADERMALASLAKVMTALVARSKTKEQSVVVIPSFAIRTEGDSGLRVGEKWSMQSLIDFFLTSSSNDGASALALAFGAKNDFISSMNLKANELGMKNTYYFNETGVDESTEKGGAYGSARDTAVLFSYILKNYPSLLAGTTKARLEVVSLDKVLHIAENTDIIVEKIPGIKGSKTGFTDLAGGNLVVAFDPEIGRPIIVVVLGSTAEDRFKDVEKLIEASIMSL